MNERTGLTPAGIATLIPALTVAVESAVYTALSDDISHVGEQAERIANALESIAQSLSTFQQ